LEGKGSKKAEKRADSFQAQINHNLLRKKGKEKNQKNGEPRRRQIGDAKIKVLKPGVAAEIKTRRAVRKGAGFSSDYRISLSPRTKSFRASPRL
jgi:hypothetical protein